MVFCLILTVVESSAGKRSIFQSFWLEQTSSLYRHVTKSRQRRLQSVWITNVLAFGQSNRQWHSQRICDPKDDRASSAAGRISNSWHGIYQPTILRPADRHRIGIYEKIRQAQVFPLQCIIQSEHKSNSTLAVCIELIQLCLNFWIRHFRCNELGWG